MDDWRGRIDTLRAQALAELDRADEHEQLEQWRVTYLGRRGALLVVCDGMGGAAASDSAMRVRGRVMRAVLM